jgi:hypothetical protein
MKNGMKRFLVEIKDSRRDGKPKSGIAVPLAEKD